MALETVGNKAVKVLDFITDIIIEIILCILFLFGIYSLWDSKQVYQQADNSNYTAYRPDTEDSVSFEELRSINPEVFAWLTVNDTPIDYPVTQTDNNEKYINTNAEGQYTQSGSIFLDYRNSPDFSDFNSIIYGHHMEEKLMFGSLSDFAEKDYFDTHPYGNLYFNGKNHGLEFFALVRTDAYDKKIFCPAVKEKKERQAYIDNIVSNAIYYRDMTVTANDYIILLSTCTSSITNGRYLLIGKISSELHLQKKEIQTPIIRIGFGADHQADKIINLPVWVWILILIFLFSSLIIVRVCFGRRISHEKREKL